jgi:hypothetical protein
MTNKTSNEMRNKILEIFKKQSTQGKVLTFE